MEPVKKNDAPGYYQVIRFPMGVYDFNSIHFTFTDKSSINISHSWEAVLCQLLRI